MAYQTFPYPLLADVQTPAAFLTAADAYTTVLTWKTMWLKTKRIRAAAATNDLEVQILGSYDNGVTFPDTVEVTYDIAAAASVVKTITAVYTHLRVQVRPNVAGVHGTLTLQCYGESL